MEIDSALLIDANTMAEDCEPDGWLKHERIVCH